LLGRGRAKKGIYEGDLIEGELEIGQISALLDDIPSVETLMTTFLKEYELATQKKNF
jgi:enoyl-[acyl-carrier protein] reductase II